MSESIPSKPSPLQELYNSIAPIIESEAGVEPQQMILNYNEELYKDMRSEAEIIMLMHGQGASDRFLYGLCASVAAIREENGGALPNLTSERYARDKEEQDSLQASQGSVAEEYFTRLEEYFEGVFPLTRQLISSLEQDLRTVLQIPETEIQEGYIPGWYKGVKVAVPVLMDECSNR